MIYETIYDVDLKSKKLSYYVIFSDSKNNKLSQMVLFLMSQRTNDIKEEIQYY